MSFNEQHFISGDLTLDRIKSVFEDAYFDVELMNDQLVVTSDAGYRYTIGIGNGLIKIMGFTLLDDNLNKKEVEFELNEICCEANRIWLMVRFSYFYTGSHELVFLYDYDFYIGKGIYTPQLIGAFKRFTNIAEDALFKDKDDGIFSKKLNKLINNH